MAVSIPAAPKSAGGTLGLQTACNLADGATEAINLYLPIPVTVNRFQFQVDIWLNFAGSGTTEHAGLGIFGSGRKINLPTICETVPTDTDGLTFGFNSDSDEARSDLYLTPGSSTGPTDVGQWSNQTDRARLGKHTTDESYVQVAGVDGQLGAQGMTVTITYLEGLIAAQLDDLPVVTYVDFSVASSGNNLVYLVYSDPFASLANPTGEVCFIFDNLKVFEIPEPLSAQNPALYESQLHAERQRRSGCCVPPISHEPKVKGPGFIPGLSGCEVPCRMSPRGPGALFSKYEERGLGRHHALASRIRLNGVSVARRKWRNPDL